MKWQKWGRNSIIIQRTFYTYLFFNNFEDGSLTTQAPAGTISKRTEVLHGEQNVVNTVLQFTSKAKSRIDACVDYTRPSLAIEIEQLRKAFLSAKRRGVRLRYVTEITEDNVIYCKELTKMVDELRHVDGIKGNFYLSETEYIVPANFHKKGKPASWIIYSNVKEIVEGITTASFFGAAAAAAFMGLSPIVGAFAVGMAVASTKLIKTVEEYVEKLQIIFAPLFFAIIGAQVDLRGVNLTVLYLSAVVVSIAIFTKLIGCGIPSLIFLRNKSKAMKVGIGMISRGEVGLIVAGVGVTSGALSTDIYTTLIIMVAVTTIVTPIWLKKSYEKESYHNEQTAA